MQNIPLRILRLEFGEAVMSLLVMTGLPFDDGKPGPVNYPIATKGLSIQHLCRIFHWHIFDEFASVTQSCHLVRAKTRVHQV